MPLSPRLDRLERAAKARTARAVVSRNDYMKPYCDAIMCDLEAHSLMTKVVKLTPDAFRDVNFDFYKAAAERPGLAEAALALSNRVNVLIAQGWKRGPHGTHIMANDC